MEKKAYYSIDPGAQMQKSATSRWKKGRARFMYLDNGFPAALPLRLRIRSEELAVGKVLWKKALEDK